MEKGTWKWDTCWKWVRENGIRAGKGCVEMGYVLEMGYRICVCGIRALSEIHGSGNRIRGNGIRAGTGMHGTRICNGNGTTGLVILVSGRAYKCCK